MALTERGIQIRIRIFAGLFVLMFLAVVSRACFLQIVHAPELQERADQQRSRVVKLAPQRGSIFDHNGEPLAVSLAAESLYADPVLVTEPASAAEKLAKMLDSSQQELEKQLNSKRRFVWLQRKMEPDLANKIKALRIPGLHFVSEYKRYYPQANTAAHILGFTGLDPNGLEGVELEYDQDLQGEPGRFHSFHDARGRGLASENQSVQGGQPGNNLFLTLDRSLQFIAEKELKRAVKDSQAKAGSVVMMEPSSGRILAMASYPEYNPNMAGKYRARARRNRAVTDTYEPGSTFKPFVLAGALEDGLVHPGQKIYCENGRYSVGGKTIRDHKKYKKLTLEETLKFSSNIGFAKIGKALERERLYSYIRNFGFGEKTGVDLPGEARGLLKAPSRWFEIDLAAISFGQALSITPLQLVTATAAFANGGLLVEPFLVERVTDAEGHLVSRHLPEIRRRVVSEKTAHLVRNMMIGVTEEGGTGTRGAVPGYLVAGKTGTAQKVDPVAGGYSIDKRVGSFVGFVPADNPAIVMAVVIDEPKGVTYGGVVAAPAFSRIAGQALTHLNLLPRGSVEALANNMDMADPLPDEAPLTTEVSENDGLTMPNFKGMSYRQVLRTMQKNKLNLKLSGSGRAVDQYPSPGKTIPYGKEAWIRFGA